MIVVVSFWCLGSLLEKDNDGFCLFGGCRIGSGRIIFVWIFEKDYCFSDKDL